MNLLPCPAQMPAGGPGGAGPGDVGTRINFVRNHFQLEGSTSYLMLGAC